MKADTLDLQKAFHGWCRLEVPLYQRPYVWQADLQWSPLWQDILAAVARREKAEKSAAFGDEAQPVPHFVGAIVLENVATTLGNIQTRQIIDGQQRLTTLQILLESLSDIARRDGHPRAEALNMLTRNPDSIVDHPDQVFKVWPTNVDRDAYRRVMLAKSAQDLLQTEGKPSHTKDIGHQIGNCYLHFFQAIDTWLGIDPEERARCTTRLFKTLAQDIQLVVIELQGRDDAQLIFETLNARGTKLLPADLIKNHLFRKLKTPPKESDVLYGTTWAEFDKSHSYWRGEIGRGHARRPRIDLLLQFYLSSRTGEEFQVEHLYSAFKQSPVLATETVQDVLRDIRKHADLFRVFEAMATQPPVSRQQLFFRRLAAMDLWTVYPFLLRLLSRHNLEDPAVITTLADVESFLVRRMVCQLSTRGYGRFFLDLIDCVGDDATATHLAVREHLLRSDAETGRWPDDAEFGAAWLSLPLYDKLVVAKVLLLLQAMERALVAPMAEGFYVTSQLTIEHLLPQSWEAHWPLPDGHDVEAVTRRNRELHTIGNLTLTSARLNATVSNSAWGTKRAELGKHVVFRMNLELVEAETWDEAAIQARGERLLELAKGVWPRPSGQ